MLVVDSHPIVREGIEVVLKQMYTEIDVRFAFDMTEAGHICRSDGSDLVLMELMLPGADPLPVMSHIARTYPNLKFVIFTALKSEARAAEAIRFGASGYLLKRCKPGDMVRAIECVLSGSIHIDPSLDEVKITSAMNNSAQSASVDELTSREKQVMTLIVGGMRNREIASLLNISQKTVDCHRQHLMQKLGARNVANVIRWAYQHGYADAGALRI
ncbi:transcriptional regulator [Burkholderia cepacia]|uniref:Transcriptional regulator n=1 Tax=Burkholderia cepacia TaxID=292 RepID=A0A0J5YVE9_BURCE|nr:response regulator transcription factor [Burkholderia cepacia]KML41363.1 transcriptional regulator [Burkholderia cepacia]